MMTAQDQKWQRESDANTLAEAQAITSDKKRLVAARTEASRMAVEAQQRANGLQSVASTQKAKKKPKSKKK